MGSLQPAFRVRVGAGTLFTLYYSTLQPSTDRCLFLVGIMASPANGGLHWSFLIVSLLLSRRLIGAFALGIGPAGEDLQYTKFN